MEAQFGNETGDVFVRHVETKEICGHLRTVVSIANSIESSDVRELCVMYDEHDLQAIATLQDACANEVSVRVSYDSTRTALGFDCSEVTHLAATLQGGNEVTLGEAPVQY